MNKYILHLILFFLISSSLTYAQKNTKEEDPQKHKTERKHHSSFSPQQYLKEKNEYMIKRVPLSPKEASAVLPLLQKQKELQRKNDKRIRLLKRKITANTSKEECWNLIGKIYALKNKNLQIEGEYARKMLEKISPQKYIRLISEEEKFNFEMLRKMVNSPARGQFPPPTKNNN